jgi:hypothetical protein
MVAEEIAKSNTAIVEEIYRDARNRAKAAVDEARKVVKDAFRSEATRLLDELQIDSFSWTQYTPYFNDGDACYFSVRSEYGLTIDGESSEDYYIRTWNLTPEVDAENERKRPMAEKFKRVTEFLNQFDEDDMLFMFDDHVEVTVTRDDITTEEYSHD